MQPDTPRAAFEKRKRALFEAALRLPESDRREFVASQSRHDPSLEEAVRRLLVAGREGSDGVLNRPVYQRKPPAPAPVPTAIGKYVVLRHLGGGGMGSVYLSHAPGMPEPVAVKIIRSDLESPIARTYFERERDVLKCLRHPNVCRLLDASVAATGVPFIVMEYVEGEPLLAFCARNASSVERRLLLFSQVLAGVEYFHARNVIHRDLKPSNLFVAPDARVKILDFGLAKMIDHPKGDTGHGFTRTAFAFMTIPYASPEQLSGHLSGRASDIYSLGLICYELITGRRPFAQASEQTAQIRLQALSTQTPTLPSYSVKGVSPSIDNLVVNALRFDPDHRYASAAAFLADLRRCLEGSTVALRYPKSKAGAAP